MVSPAVRQKVVAGSLVVMLGALIGHAGVRSRSPHPLPLPIFAAGSVDVPASAQPSASAAPHGSTAPVASGSASASTSASAGEAPKPPPLFERQLRVSVLGWDIAAPGVLSTHGTQGERAVDKVGLDVKVTVHDQATALEHALARGGADAEGADVAVLPLPAFELASERLRALSPAVFFVVGWSRGREAVYGTREVLVDAMPEAPRITVDEGSSGFVSIFAAQAAGAQPSKMKLAPAGKGGEPHLISVDRATLLPGTEPPPGRQLLSTAEATRLVPFVAVAQRALIERSTPALAAWAKSWLLGQRALEADPPAAARALSQTAGAPAPLVLLKGLGDVGASNLADNARVMGLSGRGPVTLEALHDVTFRLLRGTGQLTAPPPDASPIITSVVASLVRSDPELASSGAKAPSTVAGGKAQLVVPLGAEKGEKSDDGELSAQAAFYAGVFERAKVRVAIKKGGGVDGARTRKLLEALTEQHGIDAARVEQATKVPGKAGGVIEVLAAP